MARSRGRLWVFGVTVVALSGCDPKRDEAVVAPSAKPSASAARSQPSAAQAPSSDASDAPVTPAVPCPKFDTGRVVGRVRVQPLDESSGIAASRTNPGIVWVHNDSGHRSDVYAVDTKGELRGTYEVVGRGNVDWEDIAIGRGPGAERDWLYIADAGANKGPRETYSVHRVLEPEVPAKGPPVEGKLDDVETIDFAYADGASHDAETIMIDPVTGDFLLVTKSWTGHSEVYRSALPEQAQSPEALEKIAELRLPHDERRGSGQSTAGDISRDGSQILIRTYTDIFWWNRAPGQSIAEALRGTRCKMPIREEPQGEALAFTPDGKGYYTLSEGESQPLHLFLRQD